MYRCLELVFFPETGRKHTKRRGPFLWDIHSVLARPWKFLPLIRGASIPVFEKDAIWKLLSMNHRFLCRVGQPQGVGYCEFLMQLSIAIFTGSLILIFDGLKYKSNPLVYLGWLHPLGNLSRSRYPDFQLTTLYKTDGSPWFWRKQLARERQRPKFKYKLTGKKWATDKQCREKNSGEILYTNGLLTIDIIISALFPIVIWFPIRIDAWKKWYNILLATI